MNAHSWEKGLADRPTERPTDASPRRLATGPLSHSWSRSYRLIDGSAAFGINAITGARRIGYFTI